MKRIGLLIFFLFCLAGSPGPSTAEESGTAQVQDVLPDGQEVTIASSTQVEAPAAESPSAPDHLEVTESEAAPDQMQGMESAQGSSQTDDQAKAEEAPVAGQSAGEPDEFKEEPEEFAQSGAAQKTIPDPLEPMNRAFFVFNDKLYYWFYKPVASVYIVVAPAPVRLGIKNFFTNIFFPVRFVNNLLQAKFQGAGNELGRFLINSTIGLAGFIDVADKKFGIKESDEDFGQTLARYGVGQGFYIDWPFLGPSTVTDSVGLGGDLVLDPAFYFLDLKNGIVEKSFKTFNSASLSLEDYENMKKAALDPYIAIRDAYIQYRQHKIKE